MALYDEAYVATQRARIRELEADYRHENEGRRAIEALYTEQKARAEKAEKERDDWKECALTFQEGVRQKEARVAELEDTLRDVWDSDGCAYLGPNVAMRVRASMRLEAREREEG